MKKTKNKSKMTEKKPKIAENMSNKKNVKKSKIINTKKSGKFIFLDHTADIKFQAFGKDLKEVFKNSALAVSDVMCKDKVGGKITKKIEIYGKDEMSLLYNFIDEIVYLFDAEHFLLSEVKNLKINQTNVFSLSAELVGDDSKKYEIAEHIKSVTYSEMIVKKEKGKFTTQVVLDI